MKWFPELPDSLKGKPGQVAGPCHHFDVGLAKPDPKAKKNCPMCKGRGCYTALHADEYEEIMMSVKCACDLSFFPVAATSEIGSCLSSEDKTRERSAGPARNVSAGTKINCFYKYSCQMEAGLRKRGDNANTRESVAARYNLPVPSSLFDFMRVISTASVDWVSKNIHPNVPRSAKDTNASHLRKMALWAQATNTFPANAATEPPANR